MVGFRDVLNWVEGRLAPADADRVRAAAEVDPALGAMAQWVRSFRAAAALHPLEAPPPRVRELLVRRFEAARPAPPRLLNRVRAVLEFDSALGAPALGVRAGAPTSTRHLVLSTEWVDIALDVSSQDREVLVEGQVLPVDPDASAAGALELLRDGVVLTSTEADDTGVFAFDGVPPGDVVLVCRTDNALVDAEIALDL